MKILSLLVFSCTLNMATSIQAEPPIEVVGVQIIQKAYGSGDNNKLVQCLQPLLATPSHR